MAVTHETVRSNRTRPANFMKMVQVQFERRLKSGLKRHTTAWVEVGWRLKPGQQVTFTDDDDDSLRWTVVSVGTIVQEYADINRKWKVGGL